MGRRDESKAMNTVRVLVVEDDADIREELVDYLRFYDFHALGVADISALDRALSEEHWDVLVLDLGLPDGDGLTVAHRIRKERGLSLGIVMVTARGQTDDRVAGLDAGADSYMVKPINPRELKAVLNRLVSRLRSVTPDALDTVTPGAWRIEHNPLQLICPDGKSVTLTGAEARLLTCLFEQAGDTLTRESLAAHLNPRQAVQETRQLDSLISRLRTKVQRETGLTLPLETYRNLGYCFMGRVRLN